MPSIHLQLLIQAPAEVCFDLSLDVDLHQACFADSGERAVAGVTSGRLGLGDWVTWEAWHLGWRRRLTNQITRYDRPHQFQDETLKGAFHRFVHVHQFEATAGGTWLRERVDYESPLGVLGKLADRLFLAAYLHRLILRRAECVKAAAERWAGEHAPGSPVSEETARVQTE